MQQTTAASGVSVRGERFTQEEVVVIRERIDLCLAEAKRKVDRYGETASDDRLSDDSEMSDRNVSESERVLLLQYWSAVITGVDQALKRLERGTYGICLVPECGEEISLRRLEALPFAVRCNGCEEQQAKQVDRRNVAYVTRNHRSNATPSSWRRR